jgi:hypothetical protein
MLIATTSNDNAIVLLEVLQPNKTDVLGYLNGKNGPPQRWARVLVAQGATDEAFAVDYMVCISKQDLVLEPLLQAQRSPQHSIAAEQNGRPPHSAAHSCTGVLLSTQRTLPRAARLRLILCPGWPTAANSSNRSTAVKILLQLWQKLHP